MITITGKSDAYNYGETGKQEYDINTTVNFTEDASLEQIIEGVIRLATVMGYSVIGMPNYLRNIADDLENDLKLDARYIKDKYGEEE